MTAAHIYTAASCSAATHSGPSGRPLCAVVRGKQPFRYCLLIDCIRPHPRLLASGRSPQCIEGISFTKSFTLKNRVLHLVVRELTSMPQYPQPLTAMRSEPQRWPAFSGWLGGLPAGCALWHAEARAPARHGGSVTAARTCLYIHVLGLPVPLHVRSVHEDLTTTCRHRGI
jgi:hypothetical protein